MVKTYRSIARVSKAHGRKGEVVAVPADGLPPALGEGLIVWPVPPQLKGPRSLTVASVSGGAAGQLVSFEGVTSVDEASALVGKTLLVEEDALPQDVTLRDATPHLGREVTDVRYGELGEVTEVLRGPAQDVLVIEGAFGEVLVPFVDAFVRESSGPGPMVVEVLDSMVDVGGDQR